MTKKVARLLCIGLLLVACACSERPYYENYLPVNEQGWHKDSSATFTVEIEDTNSAYAVIFNLRANNDYPYANLYLFRAISTAQGTEYSDTANIQLADPYGRWLGEGIGELKTFSRPFRAQPLRFNRSGTYTFSFTHAMRREYLPGVEDVGLTLYKHENGQKEEN